MMKNDANRTLILDKNYNVILVTLRYIIWMYLGFFSLLMADHTNRILALHLVPKSQNRSVTQNVHVSKEQRWMSFYEF